MRGGGVPSLPHTHPHANTHPTTHPPTHTHRGGLVFWADLVGAAHVHARLSTWAQQFEGAGLAGFFKVGGVVWWMGGVERAQCTLGTLTHTTPTHPRTHNCSLAPHPP